MPETIIGAMDQLVLSMNDVGSPACVGLDPVLDRLPEALKDMPPVDAIEAFCMGVLDAVSPHVGVVKPQSACFERFGSAGMRVLERVCTHAHERRLCVILDAKRGDIGISAAHYAAWARNIGAHAITVNGYLGMDTVLPFLEEGTGASLAVFVLVRTSNPDSDAIQCAQLADGRTVAHMMADNVRTLGDDNLGTSGISQVGAVVGATKSAEGTALRQRMPNTMFLVPGFGAQGGTIDDIRALLRQNQTGSSGVVVNASRSVLYPGAHTPAASTQQPWQNGVEMRAKQCVEALAVVHR